MMKRSGLQTNMKSSFLKQYNDQKDQGTTASIFWFFFLLLSFQAFFIFFYVLIFYLTVIFLYCAPPPPLYDQHLSLIYPSLTFTIYEENMLTHQASLKELICENIFPNINIVVAPRQFFSCYQQPHIIKLQKVYYQNFTDTFNSWLYNLLL